jgi:cysteine desulfurase/selenocysteine lyase
VLRPLYHLKLKGLIEYDLVPFDLKGFVDPHDIAAAIKPNTRLVIICHASNVLGTIQPLHEIGPLCRKKGGPAFGGCRAKRRGNSHPYGCLGHGSRCLYGAQVADGSHGCGRIGDFIRIWSFKPRVMGGRASIRKARSIHGTIPIAWEAGTINLMGIIGLLEGLRFVEREGIESIHNKEMRLLSRLHDGLVPLEGVESYGAMDLENHVGLMTLNVKGMDPGDVGAILDADFDIAVRSGLHCAPLVHESIGTFPRGGVRFSLGPFNTEDHVDLALDAVSRISRARYG